MEKLMRLKTKTVLGVLLATIACASPLHAQDRGWGSGVALYGWLPWVNGELAFNVPNIGDGIIDPGELVGTVQFAFLVTPAVRYDRWAIFSDVIYFNGGADASKRVDIGRGIEIDANLDMISWLVNPGVSFEAYRSTGGTTLNVFLGARYLYLKSALSLAASGPLGADETVEESTSIWNGLAGLYGKIWLAKHWYIPYYLDIGTGESDFTWQGEAGINYDWRWGMAGLGYRYLDFDQGTDSWVRGWSLHGFWLGVGFRV